MTTSDSQKHHKTAHHVYLNLYLDVNTLLISARSILVDSILELKKDNKTAVWKRGHVFGSVVCLFSDLRKQKKIVVKCIK